MVDDGIEQSVGKIISAAFSNRSIGRADARADRLENVEVAFLLDGDEEIFSQKHADLLAAHLFFGIQIKHLRDDEEVIVVLLHLGPLASREHVFERERMEVKLLSERAENVDIPQPVDVD